jgi:hypothetical protein
LSTAGVLLDPQLPAAPQSMAISAAAAAISAPIRRAVT